MFSVVAKVDDFGGADEGEVERIEEEEKPFVLIVIKREFLELVGGGDPRVGLEEGSSLSNHSFSDVTCHKIYLLFKNLKKPSHK